MTHFTNKSCSEVTNRIKQRILPPGNESIKTKIKTLEQRAGFCPNSSTVLAKLMEGSENTNVLMWLFLIYSVHYLLLYC